MDCDTLAYYATKVKGKSTLSKNACRGGLKGDLLVTKEGPRKKVIREEEPRHHKRERHRAMAKSKKREGQEE